MSPIRRRIALLSLAAGNFSVGLSAFVVIGILPLLSADLNITPAQAGLYVTVYALTYAVASPLLVSMSGNLKRKSLLVGSLAVIAIAAVLAATATTPDVLFVARFLAAIGGGIFTPVTAAVAYSLGGPEQRGTALATVFIGLQLAQAAGVPIGVFLALMLGWPAAFWMVLAVTLTALIGLLFNLDDQPTRQTSSFAILLVAMRDRLGMAFVLITGLHVAAMSIVYAFLALLALASDASIGLTMTLFGIGGILNSVMVGFLIPRYGLKRVRLVMLSGQIFLLPLLSFPVVGLPVLPPEAFYLIVWAWAAMAVGFMVPQQILLMERRPEQGTTLISLNATSNYLGISIGSAIGGFVITHAGQYWLGIAGGAMAVITMFGAVRAERLWSRRSLGDH